METERDKRKDMLCGMIKEEWEEVGGVKNSGGG